MLEINQKSLTVPLIQGGMGVGAVSYTHLITILSTLFVYVASIFNIMSEKLAKPVGDLLLFLLSYSAQTKWVFHKE